MLLKFILFSYIYIYIKTATDWTSWPLKNHCWDNY